MASQHSEPPIEVQSYARVSNLENDAFRKGVFNVFERWVHSTFLIRDEFCKTEANVYIIIQ